MVVLLVIRHCPFCMSNWLGIFFSLFVWHLAHYESLHFCQTGLPGQPSRDEGPGAGTQCDCVLTLPNLKDSVIKCRSAKTTQQS